MNQYADYLNFAHELADTAREVTLSYFRCPLDIEDKADGSPVTIADKETERRLRHRIQQCFPQHAITGEEQVEKKGSSEYEWIIDPIDGTRSFISGYPLYGTLICLLENGAPIVSIIDMPALNERFYACADSQTVYRKRQHETVVTTKQCHQIGEAMLFSTDYTMFTEVEQTIATPLRNAVNMVRYNGDCYLYAMLSAGWIDIVLESDLKVYDFLPLCLIIEQSGGVITDWSGKPLTKNSSGQVLASANETLHQQALTLLSQNR